MSGYTDLATNFENNRNCLRRIARHNEQEFSKDSIVNVMEKFVKTVSVMDDTILVPCRLMDRQVGDSTDIIPAPTKSQLHHHSSSHHHHHHHHAGAGGNGRSRKDRNATVHEFLSSADLFNLYNMLNALKNDLLWTRSDDDDNSSTNNDDDNSTRTLSTSVSISESETNNCASEANEQQQQQQQQPNQQKSNANNNTNISNRQNINNNVSETTSTQTIKGHIRRPSTASMASSNSTSNLSDSESEISNENDSGIEYEGHCGSRSSGGSSTTSSNSKSCTNVDKATELARQCRTHLNGLYRCLEQMTEAANYLTARYQSDIGPV